MYLNQELKILIPLGLRAAAANDAAAIQKKIFGSGMNRLNE